MDLFLYPQHIFFLGNTCTFKFIQDLLLQDIKTHKVRIRPLRDLHTRGDVLFDVRAFGEIQGTVRFPSQKGLANLVKQLAGVL